MYMKLTQTELALRVGVSQQQISAILTKKAYASLPTAVAIEIATGGKYKVEDLVRPEVAEALKTFLKLRCPMFQNLFQENQAQSVEEEEKTTVEVNK